MIIFLKGRGILSYYVPKNPNKENKYILNGELQRKFLPPKSDAQREQNKQKKQKKKQAKN